MTRRQLWLALGAAVVGGTAMIQPAEAQWRDRDYRTFRYHRGRNTEEIRRREYLRDRMFDLADRIRLAVRERDLTSREADRLYDRLDDVRDFLRDDRNLSGAEFDRRRSDLNDIGTDLRRMVSRRNGRGRWYDDRYGRYDRDYHDRDRYYDRNRYDDRYYDRDRDRDRYRR